MPITVHNFTIDEYSRKTEGKYTQYFYRVDSVERSCWQVTAWALSYSSI